MTHAEALSRCAPPGSTCGGELEKQGDMVWFGPLEATIEKCLECGEVVVLIDGEPNRHNHVFEPGEEG